ncbi:hypothetical protein EYV94_24640 [Puteibacter caeruleilacunae]|nr:hypothetical protein EYV94_24640 [Puteibacter caeruleilacunae]
MKLSVALFVGMLIISSSCIEEKSIKFTQLPTVEKNTNHQVPLSAFLNFETEQDYDSVFIAINDGVNISELKYNREDKTKNGYLLVLMRAGKKINISLRLKDKKGNIYSSDEIASFATPKLPTDDKVFPKIEVTKKQNKEKQELTLFNPRRRMPISQAGSNSFNTMFGMLVIINQDGEVLWYYNTNSRISDFDMLPNGNISYMTQDNRIVEIDLAGNIINHWYAVNRPDGGKIDAIPVDAETFHHDVSLLPNGNRLVLSTEIKYIDNYYTSETEKDAPRKRQKVVGDVVIEFTPKGDVVHKWSAFDEMPVMRIGYFTLSDYWVRRGYPNSVDWSHANAIVPLPNEDAYLVNFRRQSAIVKVSKKSGKIDWIFAEPTGWGETLKEKLLTIPQDGWNWDQHSPHFTKTGNLLFFNNNNFQARPFNKTKPINESPSYVVEYKINEENRTVEKVWSTENDQEQQVHSVAMGRVSELEDSGNILACYGALLNSEYFDKMTWWNRGKYPQWTMVREYTHTQNPQVVWEIQLHPLTKDSQVGWTLFGADRIKIKNVVE